MFTQTPQKRVLFPRTLTTVMVGGFLACLVLFSILLSILGAAQASAATNSTINFQARLENAAGAIAPDGNYFIQFNLYTAASGGTSIWTEQYQGSAYSCPVAGSTATGATNSKVIVKNGYLSASLGSLCSFPTTINWDQQLWLTMNIGGNGATATWDGEMNPRLALTAVPYALKAGGLAQYNAATGFTSTLSLLQPTVGNQNFQLADQGAAGTYTICVQNSTTCGFATGSGQAILQGGNSLGVDMNIGTNDASTTLNFRTGGATRVRVNSAGQVSVGVPATIARLGVGVSAGTDIGFVVSGASAQSASLVELQNSGGTVLAKFDKDGNLTVPNVTVAASGTITMVGNTTAMRPASPTEGTIYYDTSTKQLIVYENGKWQADRNANTKIVAASNSTQAAKDAADYVADGDTATNGDGDQVQINQALSAVAATGGTVYLMEGTYTVDASVTIPNNVTLTGSGAATLLTIPNSLSAQNTNGNISVITNSDTSTGTGITIKNLRIDVDQGAQSTGTQNGIKLWGMGSNVAPARSGAHVEDLDISNARTSGIYINQSTNNVFSGNVIHNNRYADFEVDNTSNSTFTNNVSEGSQFGIKLYNTSIDNTISANTFSLTAATGAWAIELDSPSNSNTITGNAITGGEEGIIVISNNNTVTGNTVESNSTAGIEVYNASSNSVTGNHIANVGGTAHNEGIWIDGNSSSNVITGNSVADSSCTTDCYAIDIASPANANYVSNNILGGGTVNDTGTGTQYANQLNGNGVLMTKNGAGTKIQQASGQTADLLQLQSTSGNVLSGFTSNGALYTNGTANVMSGLTYPSGLGVATAGTAGSTTYGYRVSALNSQGETTAAPEVTIATGNATLSATNYNVITWNSVPGATSYKVYGRTAGAELFMVSVTATGSPSYSWSDTGTATPSGALPTGGGFGSVLTIQGGNTNGSSPYFAVKNNAGQNIFTSGGAFNGASVNGDLVINNGFSNSSPALQVTNALGTTVAAYIQAASGQSANLLELRASDGTTVLAKFDANGYLTVPTIATTNIGILSSASTNVVLSTQVTGDANSRFTLGADGKLSWGTGTGSLGTTLSRGANGLIASGNFYSTRISIGSTGTTSLAALSMVPNNAADRGIEIRGAASQTADLLNAQGNTGTTSVDANGNLVAPNITASGTIQQTGSSATNYFMGALGLGVTTPQYTLDATGDINTSGFYRVSGTTIMGVSAPQGFASTGSDYAVRGFNVANSNYYLQSYNGSATTLFAGLSGTYAGRIGIGTTMPNYRLDVSGDINIQSGSVLRIGGTQICSSTGCIGGGGGGSYITLQSSLPGTPDTGNFNISGTGIAGTLQAATLDAASAGTLNIGTTNATAINLNKNVVVASGQYISLVGGITSTRPTSPTEGMLYYDTTTKKLLVYSNGKWQADRSSSTVIVGTSVTDATSGAVGSKAPDGADYVNASTTSAQTTINSAISSLGTTGGTVYLMEGTYIIDGSITIPSNVTLMGAGQGATIIKLKNANGTATMGMIVNADTTNGNSNLGLHDLTIDGNIANNPSGTGKYYGLQLVGVGSGSGSTAVPGIRASNVTIKNANYNGIRFEGTDANSTFTNVTVSGTGNDGINVITTATLTRTTFEKVSSLGNQGGGFALSPNVTDVTVADSFIEANTGVGIEFVATTGASITKIVITGNTVLNNGGNGIRFVASGGSDSRNVISNNSVSNNGNNGIILDGATDNIVEGNLVASNTSAGILLTNAANNNTISNNRVYDNGGSTSNDGINVTISDYNSISANVITDTAGGATAYAIEVASGTGNYLSGNTYSGTGASSISDAGTGTVFANQLSGSGQLNSSNSAGVSIQAASGQSADLLDIKASDGSTVLAKFASNGNLIVPNLTVNGVTTLQETAAPTATTGFGKLYVSSSDHSLHFLNASGTDITLGSGGGGSHVKSVTMVPEYAGAIFSAASGSGANQGYMSSDYVKGLNNVNSQGYKHNYYIWDTDQTTAQDYDIVMQYQVPSDFSSFVSGSWKIWTYAGDLTNDDITWSIRSATDASCYASTQHAKPTSAANQWQQMPLGDPSSCTISAGDTITIDINVKAIQPTTNQVRVGEFTYQYNSAY